MEAYSTIVRFFQEGGVFMYPIVLVLALGLAIAVERWLYLTMTTAKNKVLWNKVTPYLKSGNFSGAAQVADKSKAAIAQIMSYGLNRVRSARRREDVEQAMEESLMEVMPRLEKRTHYLATFANIATLLGLLGTIVGLISAFTAVASAKSGR
jgi:biopolymer transport protein ExbB/TolQ